MDGRRARDTAQFAAATPASASGRTSLPRRAKTAAAEKRAEAAGSRREVAPPSPTQQRAQPPMEDTYTPLELSPTTDTADGGHQPAFITRVRSAAAKDTVYQERLKAAREEERDWRGHGGLLFRRAGAYAQLWPGEP